MHKQTSGSYLKHSTFAGGRYMQTLQKELNKKTWQIHKCIGDGARNVKIPLMPVEE